MAAAAELRGDFVHVHFLAFRAEADADQIGFDFFKDAGDDDRLDVADVVNESLGVLAFAAGAREVSLLQPEPGDLVVMRQAEAAVNVFQQPGARNRIRLINLVADGGEVRAAPDEFAGDVKRAGPRLGYNE